MSGSHLRDLLRATSVGGHQRVEAQSLDPHVELLRTWQSARLAGTYADLLADPRYADACRFFLSDVYAARDFSQRDHDVKRMYELVHGILPSSMRRALELVIELNTLTAELDAALVRVLVDELGVEDAIEVDQYAEAYRRCDNADARRRQIDLVVAVGAEIESLVHKPGVGLALTLARGPAMLGGWTEMQGFFERGFAAFRHMRGSQAFLETVASRERCILERLLKGEADPFAIDQAP